MVLYFNLCFFDSLFKNYSVNIQPILFLLSPIVNFNLKTTQLIFNLLYHKFQFQVPLFKNYSVNIQRDRKILLDFNLC